MDNKFIMSLSLNVLNHLGINLYSNIPAVLSEIVANSWDADATRVDIKISNDEIVIKDDGCGMSAEDINNKFLYVGYQKREQSVQSPKYNRKYMGRKGIGKLSMFSIAKEVDVISKKNMINESGANYFEVSGFRMNIDEITEVIKKELEKYITILEMDYLNTDEIKGIIRSFINENSIENTGTKIILKKLKKLTTSLTAEYIKKRVARRFGIIGKEFSFSVFVNGEEVSISDRDYFHKLSYIWYFGNKSKKYADYCENATHKEERNDEILYNGVKYKVTGWIGSVDASGDLKDGEDNLNKIVVLVRGKLGQEDILSEYSEGGLYSKYLIGEINADFFDEDALDDMATSNRQDYRKDDERFIALKKFVQEELKYIQGKWTELRNESGEEKAKELLPVIDTWCKSLQGDDKKYAKKMFGKINQIVADDDKKKEILKYSVLAFEKLKYAKHLSAIDKIEAENFEVFKDIFTGLDEIEATLYYQIIKERIQIINKFREITQDDQSLEKVIQQYLFNHLWLLDPSWERADHTEYMEKTVLNALNVQVDSLTDEEKKGRLDLGYRQAAGKHIVIELKKADRVVKRSEAFNQIVKYHDALSKALNQTCGSSFSFEILFIIGRPIDNNTNFDDQQLLAKSLEPYHARIVTYQQLIENALRAYNEYIEANKTSQPLVDMLSQLDSETTSDHE